MDSRPEKTMTIQQALEDFGHRFNPKLEEYNNFQKLMTQFHSHFLNTIGTGLLAMPDLVKLNKGYQVILQYAHKLNINSEKFEELSNPKNDAEREIVNLLNAHLSAPEFTEKLILSQSDSEQTDIQASLEKYRIKLKDTPIPPDDWITETLRQDEKLARIIYIENTIKLHQYNNSKTIENINSKAQPKGADEQPSKKLTSNPAAREQAQTIVNSQYKVRYQNARSYGVPLNESESDIYKTWTGKVDYTRSGDSLEDLLAKSIKAANGSFSERIFITVSHDGTPNSKADYLVDAANNQISLISGNHILFNFEVENIIKKHSPNVSQIGSKYNFQGMTPQDRDLFVNGFASLAADKRNHPQLLGMLNTFPEFALASFHSDLLSQVKKSQDPRLKEAIMAFINHHFPALKQRYLDTREENKSVLPDYQKMMLYILEELTKMGWGKEKLIETRLNKMPEQKEKFEAIVSLKNHLDDVYKELHKGDKRFDLNEIKDSVVAKIDKIIFSLEKNTTDTGKDMNRLLSQTKNNMAEKFKDIKINLQNVFTHESKLKNR